MKNYICIEVTYTSKHLPAPHHSVVLPGEDFNIAPGLVPSESHVRAIATKFCNDYGVRLLTYHLHFHVETPDGNVE